jgi:hypothetical protein
MMISSLLFTIGFRPGRKRRESTEERKKDYLSKQKNVSFEFYDEIYKFLDIFAQFGVKIVF